jgi:GT2 family glycosyltransferase
MLDSESPGEASEPFAAPPVVAVVVTRDPGPWLEEALESIAGSDYPALTTLVLDAGSTVDPTARVAAVAPGMFVRRLPEDAGFATVANDVLDVVTGATFLLFVHDDVVLDPSAIRLLVEEAYRSNAAILGPKLVDYDRPEVLLEVGMAIDRLGHPHSGIEPGELDQEQHDAVRDVFFV